MRARRLPRSFFARPTLEVALELIGKLLVRKTRSRTITGRITEVEVYRGEDDLACHASHGRTKRTATLYAHPGTVYIYLVYGIYHCLNIVTEKEGFPAAVLIRSCEFQPTRTTKTFRTNTNPNALVGPGKLCKTLQITRALNGENLPTSQKLWVAEDRKKFARNKIGQSPRIGVDYAGPCAGWPWRFFLRDSPFVSRQR